MRIHITEEEKIILAEEIEDVLNILIFLKFSSGREDDENLQGKVNN